MSRSNIDVWAAGVARILLGGFFVVSAILNLTNVLSTSENIAIQGAFILVVSAALFKFTFGIALAFRFHTKYAALGLLIYLSVISILFYGPQHWSETNLYNLIFVRNIAIIGGLLFIYSYSRGVDTWNERWIPQGQSSILKRAQELSKMHNK